MQMQPYLIRSLDLAPKAIARIVRSIPASRYDEKLQGNRFTIREVLAHLADFEPIFRGRIQQAAAEPGSKISSRDEEQMAIEHKYSEWNVEETLATFAKEREETITFLRSLQAESFESSVIHEQLGPMTLNDLAGFVSSHDVYHIEQLTEYLTV